MPTVGSLFSGTGLLDLGLEWAGFRTVWQVEWDAFRRGLLTQRFPWAIQHGDIAAVDFTTLPQVDLLAGGFPCTPASAAGKRRGRADERWLWPEFARAVRDLRPHVVFVENSPRLLVPYSDERGRWHRALIEDVVGDLAALGYDAEWDCIPAAAVGAPHERDRVWIVAADASGDGRRLQPVAQPWGRNPAEPDNDGAPRPVADAEVFRRRRAHAELAGFRSSGGGGWWAAEPDVGRVAHGRASRLDRPRLRALGDGVVPQLVELIGRWIMSEHFA